MKTSLIILQITAWLVVILFAGAVYGCFVSYGSIFKMFVIMVILFAGFGVLAFLTIAETKLLMDEEKHYL